MFSLYALRRIKRSEQKLPVCFIGLKYLHKKKTFENWRNDLIYNTTRFILLQA